MAKSSVKAAAREAMQKFGYDPLEVMVVHAMAPETPESTKLEIAEVLLPYMYPKLSNVTVEGEVIATSSETSQRALMAKILSNPDLADAASKLSLAAAESYLDETGTVFGGVIN